MPEEIREVADRFVEQVRKLLKTKLSRIILYGSYARGDFKDNSDIDLMILVRDMSENEIRNVEEKLCDIAFDIELEKTIHISAVVKDAIQFETWKDVLPFYSNVSREGVEIGKEQAAMLINDLKRAEARAEKEGWIDVEDLEREQLV